jgi:eukaryotic-like serine/threonine-protein kinase
VGDAGIQANLSLSPDGKAAAVTTHDSSVANIGIWLYDLARGLRTRFAGPGSVPVWSPDGKTIVFQSNRTGRIELYRKPVDGSHDEELLYSDKLEKSPADFSPDGKYLAYAARSPETGLDIWMLQDPLGPLGGSGSSPFVHTGFNEQGARFSPDGHWIAYYSNESARNEVYVAPFPGPGGRVQVSTAGGATPRWNAHGKELFYLAPGGRLMAAQIEARPGSFAIKKVDKLFGPLNGLGASYDASADGQRFLASLPPEGQTGGPMTVVLNWPEGLRKLP